MALTREELEAAIAAAERYPPGCGNSWLGRHRVATSTTAVRYLREGHAAAADG